MALTALIVLIAAVTDARTRKIYNWLTFPAMLVGFVFSGVTGHGHGLLMSVGGMALAVFGIGILALLSALTMGDVKLFAAIGSLWGPPFLVTSFIFSAFFGAVHALIRAAQVGALGHTLKNAMLGAHVVSATRSTENLKGMAGDSKAGYIPYGPAIACGTMLACLFERLHWHLF